VTEPWTTAPTARAAFGWNQDNAASPYQIRLTDIVDGTSNSLLMSEVLQGADSAYDFRGDILNDAPYYAAAHQFMTINTPNSGVPDINLCVSNPDPAMPCTSGAKQQAAARSHHSGGVNTLFGDGSVHFIADAVSLSTWQALGTIDGGDILGDY
jgi:prepilin-type processing-associated H-X9-DG protein